MDYIVVTGLALIFLLITWAYGRALSAGRPLNAFKRRLLAYGFIFVLGTCYLMVLVRDLGWLNLLWPMLVAWGTLVVLVAWWRYRRRKTSEASRERTQNSS